jgi:hypothetical protein
MERTRCLTEPDELEFIGDDQAEVLFRSTWVTLGSKMKG